MPDEFTFRSRATQAWLALVLVLSVAIASSFPPAFWLCGIGAASLILASLANSSRTGQWYSWQNEGSLSGFEGWAAASGAVLLVVPLVAVILRSWLST